MGKLGTWLLALTLVVGAFLLLAAPVPAQAANVSLALYGSSTSGWGNASSSITTPGPTLVVHQGDVVTIMLTSQDGFAHQFLIDYNMNGVSDAGEPMSSAFTSTTTLTFTADTVGTFPYFCLYHPTVMKGTFVVLASNTPSPPPSSVPPPTSSPTASGGNDPTLLVVGAVILVAVVAGVAILVLRRNR